MKRVLILLLLMGTSVGQAAPTARDYYNELVDAHGLDGFANEYVCFADTPSDNFFIFATSDTLRRTASYQADLFAKEGDKAGEKEFRAVANIPGDYVTYRSYSKGISAGERLLLDKNKHADANSSDSYSTDVAANGHTFRLTLWINLGTGRYAFAAQSLERKSDAAKRFGRCEPTKTKEK